MGTKPRKKWPPAGLTRISPANTRSEPSDEESQGTAQVQASSRTCRATTSQTHRRLTAPGKLGERTTTSNSDGDSSLARFPPASSASSSQGPALIHTRSTFPIGRCHYPGPETALKIATSSTVDVTPPPTRSPRSRFTSRKNSASSVSSPTSTPATSGRPPPCTTRQKYKLSFRAIADPATFLIVAGVAGAEHYNGTYPGYGPGIEGYGKRYGAALGRLHHRPHRRLAPSSPRSSTRTHATSTRAQAASPREPARRRLRLHLPRRQRQEPTQLLAHPRQPRRRRHRKRYHPEASRGVGLTFQTLGITTWQHRHRKPLSRVRPPPPGALRTSICKR